MGFENSFWKAEEPPRELGSSFVEQIQALPPEQSQELQSSDTSKDLKPSYEQFDEDSEDDVRLSLEEEEPGCIDYCSSEFNISHFARYPREVVLDMYRNRNQSGSWGVMYVAKGDHNGASYHQIALEEMHTQIGDAVGIKIVEVGSLADVRHYSARLAARGGPASFAIIAAHGHEDGFDFGEQAVDQRDGEEEAKQKYPNTENLDNQSSFEELTSIINDILLPEAGLCFVSCSTGKDQDSIAMRMGAALGRDVSAPTTDTNIKSFGASLSRGGVSFAPVYYDGSARQQAA